MLIASAALAACTAARAPTSTAIAPGTGHDDAPAMPGPGPITRTGDVVALDAECTRCHADVGASWHASLHAQAYTDPIYQRSFAVEPGTFCHDCHAPERASAEHGIGCVTCHDPRGTGIVLAAPSDPSTPARAAAPHRITRDARFGGEGACAGCHDFAFPDVVARGNDGARMQRTIDEHRASRFASRTCASCHMPKTASGARGHAFTTAGDLSMLRRALVVRSARRDGDSIVLELEPGDVGHAFPTGDLFRRLLVTAEATAEDYRIVARAERPLGRHFRYEPSTLGAPAKVQRETGDDRIDRPRSIALDLGEAARGNSVAWRIEYQRVESMHGDHATIADSIVVAQGLLETGGTAR